MKTRDELRALAQAAPHEKWQAKNELVLATTEPGWPCIAEATIWDGAEVAALARAAFIAACDPPTMLALLDALGVAEAALARVESACVEMLRGADEAEARIPGEVSWVVNATRECVAGVREALAAPTPEPPEAKLSARYVVMFSSGAGSWAAARRIVDAHGPDAVTPVSEQPKE